MIINKLGSWWNAATCFLLFLLQKPWQLASKFHGWVAGNSHSVVSLILTMVKKCAIFLLCLWLFWVPGIWNVLLKKTRHPVMENARRLGQEAAHNDLTVCWKPLERCFWQEKPPGLDLQRKIQRILQRNITKLNKKKSHDCYGILTKIRKICRLPDLFTLVLIYQHEKLY